MVKLKIYEFVSMKPNLAFTKIDSSLFLCDIVIPDGCHLISILILMYQKHLFKLFIKISCTSYHIFLLNHKHFIH